MKNFEKISEIYELFKFNDVHCYVELDRLKNNFEIDDDELIFDIKAESAKELKELAEKLITEGKSYLVGDDEFVKNKEYLKQSIKTIIYAKNRFGKKTLFRMSIRIDEEGEIACIVCPSKYSEQRKYAKKVVECWLNKEFGAL